MNLAEILTSAVGSSPDAVALDWRDERISYADLTDRSARLAGGLRDIGVEPGARVGIVCANNPTFVTAYLAVLRIGAAAVPVNPAAAPEEARRELAATGAEVVVVGPSGRKLLADPHAPPSGALRVVAAGTSGDDEMDAGDGAIPIESLLEADPAETTEVADDHLAVLAHTSGTAGAPKAAMLTHGSLAANIVQAQGHPTMRIEAGDVVLAVVPLFHSFGLNAVLGLGLAHAVTVVLAERFDPQATYELVRDRKVTVLPGVPPMFSAWLSLPGVPDDAFASVRVAVSGAAPLEPLTQQMFHERFDLPLHQGYGLTEASPVVTTTGASGDPRPGSIGVPLPGVEVRLVGGDEEDVLVGDPGEIWIRGPNVFAGYWENDEATKAVLTPEGWLRTGDVAVTDDDGFLFLVDRSKDLIIVSGFNVYPAEVEEVLTRHDGVAEAAVVGMAHPHSGEAVKAFVVPTGGAPLEEEELVQFCARHLARYKCPAAIEVVDALPRGLTGKVVRRELDPGLDVI